MNVFDSRSNPVVCGIVQLFQRKVRYMNVGCGLETVQVQRPCPKKPGRCQFYLSEISSQAYLFGCETSLNFLLLCLCGSMRALHRAFQPSKNHLMRSYSKGVTQICNKKPVFQSPLIPTVFQSPNG